jgi:hypothetical protein
VLNSAAFDFFSLYLQIVGLAVVISGFILYSCGDSSRSGSSSNTDGAAAEPGERIDSEAQWAIHVYAPSGYGAGEYCDDGPSSASPHSSPRTPSNESAAHTSAFFYAGAPTFSPRAERRHSKSCPTWL